MKKQLYDEGNGLSYTLQGKLVEHLKQTDQASTERMDLLVVKMAERQGVTEQLKAENQLLWVVAEILDASQRICERLGVGEGNRLSQYS